MGSEGWVGHWSPGIGDPSIIGWLTVLAYFLAAWMCWKARRAASISERPGARRSAALWTAIAVALVLLGINKQLDLQTAFTEVGRILAHRYGWYEQRHQVQLVFIGTVAAVGAAMFLLLLIAVRRELSRLFIALFGIAGLGCFVLIRAASFHHFDQFIGYSVGGFRMNWLMELGGIALVMIGALYYRRDKSMKGTKNPCVVGDRF